MSDKDKKSEGTPAPDDNSGGGAAPAEPVVSGDLSKEIDVGVESAMEEVERDRQEREAAESGKEGADKINLPPAKAPAGDVPEGGETPKDGEGDDDPDHSKDDEGGKPKKPEGDDDDKDVVTDELLERAVKAGLPMAEARKIGVGSVLASVCERMEKALNTNKAGEEDGGENPDDNSSGSEIDEMLAKIPDLDPEKYDDNVVGGFKALKGIIGHLQEKLTGLQTANVEGERSSWFDSKVEGLDKSLAAALEKSPDKLASLREEFETLEAGYKARGGEVDRSAIFEKAVVISLGDVQAEARKAATESSLRDRKGQFINRPDGSSTTPKTDAFEETASEVDDKYFGKK